MSDMHKKVIIIGAGPAGLSAACACIDSGISPDDLLVIERDTEPGGILNQCIHAGFGLHRFGEELTGPEYAGRYIRMAEERNVRILTNAMVLNLTPDKVITFISPETGYVTMTADAVILAMGCRERTRGAIGIPGSRPSGIYTAGCAQRYINIEGFMNSHLTQRVLLLSFCQIHTSKKNCLVIFFANFIAINPFVICIKCGKGRNTQQKNIMRNTFAPNIICFSICII